MKRLLRLSLTVLLLLALVPAAGADVIWEPQNSFYETHRDQCEYVGRGYYANGREGFITLWEAPEGDRFTAQYENGQELTLYYRYRDWGCLSRWEDGREVSGWVPLSDLVLVYDHISFAEEYDIRPYAGEFAGYAGGAQSVHFYEYPGAPEVKYTWALDDPSWDVLDRLTGGKYGKVTLDRDFDAAAEEAGELAPRPVLALSQGTADQLYLAVRLAICSLVLP